MRIPVLAALAGVSLGVLAVPASAVPAGPVTGISSPSDMLTALSRCELRPEQDARRSGRQQPGQRGHRQLRRAQRTVGSHARVSQRAQAAAAGCHVRRLRHRIPALRQRAGPWAAEGAGGRDLSFRHSHGI